MQENPPKGNGQYLHQVIWDLFPLRNTINNLSEFSYTKEGLSYHKVGLSDGILDIN